MAYHTSCCSASGHAATQSSEHRRSFYAQRYRITLTASIVHMIPAACDLPGPPVLLTTTAPIATAVKITATATFRPAQRARIRFFQKIAVSTGPVGASAKGALLGPERRGTAEGWPFPACRTSPQARRSRLRTMRSSRAPRARSTGGGRAPPAARPGTLLPIGRAPLARRSGTARARRQPVPSR